MSKYSYLFFNSILFTPVITILLSRGKKIIIRNTRLIFSMLVIGILGDIFEDKLGISWYVWFYDQQKNIGIIWPGVNVDTLIFAIGSTLLFTLGVIIFAEKEEKKKPFWPL